MMMMMMMMYRNVCNNSSVVGQCSHLYPVRNATVTISTRPLTTVKWTYSVFCHRICFVRRRLLTSGRRSRSNRSVDRCRRWQSDRAGRQVRGHVTLSHGHMLLAPVALVLLQKSPARKL